MTSPLARNPHAEQAQVPAAKLRDYVLNPAHPQGGAKVRVFAAVLGITRDDWPYLREQLLAGVQRAAARRRASTQWGELYEAAFEITGRGGRTHRVRTA